MTDAPRDRRTRDGAPRDRQARDDAPSAPRADRVIRWGYWLVLVLLAIGAGRTLWRLAERFGWT